MLRSVLGKSLYDLRRSFAWWSLGLAGLVAMYAAVYPSVRDNEQLNELVESYPEALREFFAFGGQLDLVSGAGYLGAELFSFMAPLLFLVAAIGAGAGSIAGEEERGTLEVLLSVPVSRARIASEKAAGIGIEVAGLGLVLWALLLVATPLAEFGVSVGNLAAACLLAVLLALGFGGVAFLLGAATGRRALAIGVTSALAVLAYVLNGLAPLVSALEPFQKLSPFYHYSASDPLREGIDWWRALLLGGIVAATTVLGVLAFRRRDVGV